MTYDIIPFFNEVELLKIRLTELDPVVDRFVICESPVTFKGDKKPLYFRESMGEFKPWAAKIIHWIIDDMPMVASLPYENGNDGAWQREYHQRMAPARLLVPQDDDVVLFCDCDEIPRASAVRLFNPADECVSLSMQEYSYFLNLQLPQYKGDANIMTGRFMKAQSRHQLRGYNGACPRRVIDNAGWHFSSMGGSRILADKLKSFSHWNSSHMAETVAALELKGEIPIAPNSVKVLIDNSYPEYIRNNVANLAEKGFLHLPLL